MDSNLEVYDSVSRPPGRGPGTGPWHQLYRAARGL